ncbi:hypothetical protein D3C80_1104550 [compost metagenome]
MARSASWPRCCQPMPTWSTRWTSPRRSGATAPRLSACSTAPCAPRPMPPCWCSTTRRSLPASARSATCCWSCTARRSSVTARPALSPRPCPNCCRPSPASACMPMALPRCRASRMAWRPGGGLPHTRANARRCSTWASQRCRRCARRRCKARASCSTNGNRNKPCRRLACRYPRAC